MQTQALILDRDKTLLDLDPATAARVDARVASLMPGLSLAAIQAVWESWPGPWPRYDQQEEAFWQVFCAAVVRAHSPTSDGMLLAQELAAIYHTFFRSYPEVPAALAALRASGLRLAVLSNFELPSIARTLAHAGLEPAQFDVILSASTIGFAKPHPRAYLAVAEALALPPSACCLIDDLAENVAGARLVGMRAFQIDRSLPRGESDGGTISSLLDLVGLLTAVRPPGVAVTSYDRQP